MSLVTPQIASLRPYIPGKPVEELERELGISGAVKLASNENPLGPSPKAIEAMRHEASQMHFYPEGDGPYLRARLAEHLSVEPNEIVLGNGSNEVLELLVRTFATPEHHAVVSDHAFLVYPLVLKSAGIPYVSVPMVDFKHNLVGMKAAIQDNTRLVFIANPNNPTGTYNTTSELRAFLDGLPEDCIVAIDEAYFEYVDADDYPNGIELRAIHPNVVVTRTFSKCYGLAGLRVGYGVARPELIDFMNRVRQPFNSSRMSQAAALAALDDDEFLTRTVRMNNENRAKLKRAIEERGLTCLPSAANFLLFKVPRPGVEICQELLQWAVIIRPMAGYGLPDWVRVTIGTTEENEQFLSGLDAVLG